MKLALFGLFVLASLIASKVEGIAFLTRLLGLQTAHNPAFECNNPRPVDVFDDATVEVQLVKFKNEDDDKYNDADCDTLPGDDCDYRVSIRIDADNIFQRWPEKDDVKSGFTPVIREWQKGNNIDYGKGNMSTNALDYIFTSCKFIQQPFAIVVARVKVEDVDVLDKTELVNNFNCYWSPQSMQQSNQRGGGGGDWHDVNCCTALECDMDTDVTHELVVKFRLVNGNQCNAQGIRP